MQQRRPRGDLVAVQNSVNRGTSKLIQYFQKHKAWVLERIFLLTLAIDWIYRIDLNCVDSKKTGTEHNQYRVRRRRARLRQKKKKRKGKNSC